MCVAQHTLGTTVRKAIFALPTATSECCALLKAPTVHAAECPDVAAPNILDWLLYFLRIDPERNVFWRANLQNFEVLAATLTHEIEANVGDTKLVLANFLALQTLQDQVDL